jgi:ribosomal protein S1
VHVRGSTALNRADHVVFTIEYADGSSESFRARLTDDDKPTVGRTARFLRDTPEGTIVKVVILSAVKKGIKVEIDGYGVPAFINISHVPDGRPGKIYRGARSGADKGKQISARYIGIDGDGTIQLSLMRVR